MVAAMAKGPWKKTLTPKKGLCVKVKPQNAPTLDTEEGRAEIQPAGEWLLGMERKFGRKEILNAIQNAEGSACLCFSLLPGYAEAEASARRALALLAGRQDGVRKLFRVAQGACEMSVALRSALVLELAEYDGCSHIPYLTKALHAEEAKGTRRKFVQSLTEKEDNAARKPLPKPYQGPQGRVIMLPWPWADVSPLRFTLVVCWVGCGFWLAEDHDIAACLEGKPLLQAFRGRPPTVTEAAIREARKALGLVSYKGAGRVKWVADQWTPDETLRAQPLPDNAERQHLIKLLREKKYKHVNISVAE